MCLICIEYQKGKLKPKEALRNLGEIKETITEDHHKEVYDRIEDDLLQEQLDEYWELVGFGD